MNDIDPQAAGHHGDIAPGDQPATGRIARGVRGYVIGFALAAALTGVSFYITRSTLVWTPSIPIALSVLAVAQMGVHVVFFLHMTSGPDNVNNLMAFAFGLLIVLLLVLGSIWIMSHLSHAMMAAEHVMRMQR